MENADRYLDLLPSDLPAAVPRGEIDLNKVAAVILAGRGLDPSARWGASLQPLDFWSEAGNINHHLEA